MSGHKVATAFEFIASPDFLTKGALASARERLAVFQQLYKCQWTCQTIFQQALTPIAQNYATRLLCVTTPVKPELVNTWIMPEEQEEEDPWAAAHGTSASRTAEAQANNTKHVEALQQLQRLCILLPTEILDKKCPDHMLPLRLLETDAGIVMNPVFQQNLQRQLFSFETPMEKGANEWSMAEYVATERSCRGRLRNYSAMQCIVHLS